ncbi:uncharacterized protein LOC142523913 [Primulina tabacum]|uniref:uncharacterized protein LOC142523913 n=1 Tax=Primulina tabacum TaxID=48773 RepID=UPI003F5A7DE7
MVSQILEDLIRDCMIDFQGSWEPKLPLVKFTYNNSYQASIGMAPYEAMNGWKCRSSVYWDEVGEREELGQDIVSQTAELVVKIRHMMRTAQSRQKSYAYQRRRDLEFAVEDHLTPNLTFEERLTQILDTHERKLQNKVIHMVKVKWLNHSED